MKQYNHGYLNFLQQLLKLINLCVNLSHISHDHINWNWLEEYQLKRNKMNQRRIEALKALFRQASEIAEQVPESMQQAAFNRALDLLTQTSPIVESKSPHHPESSNAENTGNEVTQSVDIITAVDPARHPNITASGKVLDRSLMVLEVAYKEYGVDGLTPGQIAEILTMRFNISTKSTTICNALDLAPALARRISDGTRFIYKIMLAGEDYLINLEQEKRL